MRCSLWAVAVRLGILQEVELRAFLSVCFCISTIFLISACGLGSEWALRFSASEDKAWKTHTFQDQSMSVELPAEPVEISVPDFDDEYGNIMSWSMGESDQNLVFFISQIKRDEPLTSKSQFRPFVDYWIKANAYRFLPETYSPQIEIEKLSDDHFLGIVRAVSGRQAKGSFTCLALDEDLKTIRIVMSGVTNDGQSDFRNFRRAMTSAVFGGKTCEAAIEHGRQFWEDHGN